MSFVYRPCYKCRMCGREYQVDTKGKDNKDEVEKYMYSMVHDILELEMSSTYVIPNREHAHRCADGSISLSDFLGFKKVENYNE